MQQTKTNNTPMPRALIYVTIAMLLIGILKLPYSYYILLRIVVCGVLVGASYLTYHQKCEHMPWLFGILAVLFNPFFRMPLAKEWWMVINIGVAVLLLINRNKLSVKK